MLRRALTRGRRFAGGLSTDTRAGLFGLGWSYLGHGTQLVFRFVSSLILTRLLMPEVYGTFGPALSIIFLLELLSDIGLRPVIGRSPQGESPVFLGTAWSLSIVRGFGLALATLGLSTVMPSIYDKELLGPVLAVLSIRPIIWSLQNPMLFVLYRRLDYRPAFLLDVLQTIGGMTASISLAIWLNNVWALVFGMLAGDVFRVVLSHVVCPRAPRLRWDRPSLHELSHFGLTIFINTLVYGAWLYFDRLTGPRVLSDVQMGLYTVAWTLAEGADALVGRACEVFYSLLARKSNEADKEALFRTTLRRVSWYLLPLIAVAALVAPIAFRLLYPTKFEGAAIVLGLLVSRLAFRLVGQTQFMYLMMRGQVAIATRAYLFAIAAVAIAFTAFGILRGWDQFTPTEISILAVGGVGVYCLAQTVGMLRRGHGSIGPTLWALFWTIVAIVGVLCTA